MFQYLKRSRLNSHFIDVEVRIDELLKDFEVDKNLHCILSSLCVKQLKEYKDYKSSIECDALIAICLTQYKSIILKRTNSNFNKGTRIDLAQCIGILETLMPDLILSIRTSSSKSDNKTVDKVLSDIELHTKCFHHHLISDLVNSILCASCWWGMRLEDRINCVQRPEVFLLFSGYIKAMIDTHQISFMLSRLDTLNCLYKELINKQAPTLVDHIESHDANQHPHSFKAGYTACIKILKGEMNEAKLIDYFKECVS